MRADSSQVLNRPTALCPSARTPTKGPLYNPSWLLPRGFSPAKSTPITEDCPFPLVHPSGGESDGVRGSCSSSFQKSLLSEELLNNLHTRWRELTARRVGICEVSSVSLPLVPGGPSVTLSRATEGNQYHEKALGGEEPDENHFQLTKGGKVYTTIMFLGCWKASCINALGLGLGNNTEAVSHSGPQCRHQGLSPSRPPLGCLLHLDLGTTRCLLSDLSY